jgi:hypothetical protein
MQLECYVESSDGERYLSFGWPGKVDLEQRRLSLSADDAESLGRDLKAAAAWLDMHLAKAATNA